MPPRVAVTQAADESWTGLCEGPGCGYPPFSTRGWPTKKIASERIRQHQDEHLSGEENPDDPSKHRLMESLELFNARHGLVQSTTPNNMVFPDDATVLPMPKDEGK